MKYFQPILSAISLVLLGALTYIAQEMKTPGKETSYYIGFVIVALVFPPLGAFIAALVKKTTQGEKRFDWPLFQWFLIGFAAVSIFSRIFEIRALSGG